MIDFFIINKILLILITAIGLWLGLLVYLNNRKARINQLFILMIFSALLWIIPCYFAVKLVDNIDLSLFLARLAYGLAVLFMIPFYFFAINFIGEKNESLHLKILIPVGSILISFFSVFTNFMAKDVTPVKIGLVPALGEGKFIYFGFVLFIALYILFRLFKNYFKSSEGEKLKLKYFLLGFSIFVVANLIFNVILPFRQEIPQYYQFGNYSAIFFFGFTAYAIVKRQLFDIKIVLTQLLVSIFAILLFVQIFFSNTTFEYARNTLTFIIFVVVGYFFIKEFFRGIETQARITKLEKQVLEKELKTEKGTKEAVMETAEYHKRKLYGWMTRDEFLENMKLKQEILKLVARVEELEKELEKKERKKKR